MAEAVTAGGDSEGVNSPVSIRSLHKQTVHRICSGQVVVSLATAVKELIENSLDAQSTSIEVKLKGYGIEAAEVIDNGTGVEEENIQALTLKHFTSKLREFDDLMAVETYGFRGEALSSLCALSRLSILSRHQSSSVGTHAEYDTNGKIVKSSVVSRPVGTTVILKDLFYTLPVRHKEFVKNIKREFAKMLNVIYAYCLIATNARILCTNQAGKTKSILVSTQNHGSLKENISSVYGSKQLNALLEIRQVPPTEEVLAAYSLKPDATLSELFCITGFISTCHHGCGRSSTDRQHLFVNGRPCDLPKVCRVINEEYQTFNRNQYPFVVLNITLNRDSVDVNVTPDKRQVFLEHEKLLLAVIKCTLRSIYEPLTSVIRSPFTSPSVLSDAGLKKCAAKGQSPQKLSTQFGEAVHNSDDIRQYTCLKRSLTLSGKAGDEACVQKETPRRKQPRVDNFFLRTSESQKSDFVPPKPMDSSLQNPIMTPTEDVSDVIVLESDESETDDGLLESPTSSEISISPGNARSNSMELRKPSLMMKDVPEIQSISDKSLTVKSSLGCESRVTVELEFTMEDLRRRLQQKGVNEEKRSDEIFIRRFRSKIAPEENKKAEEELQKQMSKSAFSEMKIIGQFNHGFIITKLKSDLFIIDQHASDEKYNFEMLKKQTVMETQKLMCPIPLELTSANETLLIEHIDLFRRNGFNFDIQENAECGQRVRLVSVPVSKRWTFGKEDIEELLFMVSDGFLGSTGSVTYRPSRIEKMFASRACRKSVMIGTPLTRNDMKKLVLHMGEMEQPWNTVYTVLPSDAHDKSPVDRSSGSRMVLKKSGCPPEILLGWTSGRLTTACVSVGNHVVIFERA